jgi:hypothetical protein
VQITFRRGGVQIAVSTFFVQNIHFRLSVKTPTAFVFLNYILTNAISNSLLIVVNCIAYLRSMLNNLLKSGLLVLIKKSYFPY